MMNHAAAAEANDMEEAAATPSLSDTLEVMRRVLERKFGIPSAELTMERELATLGLDSLAFIEYAFELESELDVNFPDLPRDLATVGDLARFVHGEVVRKDSEAPVK